MNTHKHKMRWGIVLAAGIVAFAIGAFLDYYAIAVVERGRYPANYVLWMIQGSFCFGLGLGIISCVPAIRSLEMKLR